MLNIQNLPIKVEIEFKPDNYYSLPRAVGKYKETWRMIKL